MSDPEHQKPESEAQGPSLAEQVQRAAQSWDARYGAEHTYLDKSPVEAVRHFFSRYREQLGDGPFLDIGIGNGRNAELPARLGIETRGIDASQTALDQLKLRCEREQLDISAVKGSFHDLPYEDETFTGAMSINVFQHNDWAGAQQAFAEVARVLKPGALFLFQARSTNHPYDRHPTMLADQGVTYIPEGGTKSGLALHHYTLEELKELGETNGLELVEQHEKVRRGELNADGTKKKDLGQWIAVFRKRSGDSPELHESWVARDELLEQAPERARAFEELVTEASPTLRQLLLFSPLPELAETLVGVKPATTFSSEPAAQPDREQLAQWAERTGQPIVFVESQSGHGHPLTLIAHLERLYEVANRHPDLFPVEYPAEASTEERLRQFQQVLPGLFERWTSRRSGVALGYPRSAIEPYARLKREVHRNPSSPAAREAFKSSLESQRIGGLWIMGVRGVDHSQEPEMQRYLQLRDAAGIESLLERLREQYRAENEAYLVARRAAREHGQP